MNVKEESNDMRRDALELINKWNLLEHLSKYGDAYTVGSVALDLMTWRDIDLEVICNKEPTRKNAFEVAELLFLENNFRRVTPIDYRNGDGIAKPKGLYIGGEYINKDKNKWKVDVWLLTPDSANAKKKTQEIKGKLTPEYKKRILNLKSQLHNHPKYRKQILSVDIYDAVLNRGVASLEDFKKYLQEIKNINL